MKSMVKAVLFDLDGTLLPMDQDKFTQEYFGALSKAMAPHVDPRALVNAVWAGTEAMVKNDGAYSNSDVFWSVFTGIFGAQASSDIEYFDAFYATVFPTLRSNFGFEPRASQTVERLRKAGKRLVLASNPIFPLAAQQSRVEAAGVDIGAFEFFTSYENSHYCKPNPLYYTEIVERLGLDPSECLMVGNDATEDMIARKVGLDVFLLTDGLINTKNVDITEFDRGDYDALNTYLDGIL